MQRIGVFGAYGHTGRFVAAELDRRGIGVRLIGRDRASLDELGRTLHGADTRAAFVDRHDSLVDSFAGLDCVINCAGPFFDTSRPVIQAALSAGCHYLDVTAEQPTVLHTIATFDDAAKVAGRVVMPAVAFYGALADLLATSVMGTWPDADAVDVAVALDSWHPTLGTRRTGKRNTAPRLVVRDWTLQVAPIPPLTTDWRFPEPFGVQTLTCLTLSEVVLLNRHLRARNVTSYMNAKPLSDLHDEATPPPRAVDAIGRSDQRFVMSVRARRGSTTRTTTVSGRDIYAVTAPIAVEACLRLLSMTAPRLGGVRAPGEIFDADAFLRSLRNVLVPSSVTAVEGAS